MPISITDVLQSNGLPPMSNPSGLTKNVRKRRNKKVKRAAAKGYLSNLLGSREYHDYINQDRFKKKVRVDTCIRVHSLPGSYPIPWSGTPPNAAKVDYAEDDPAGWTHVGTHNRRRRAQFIEN